MKNESNNVYETHLAAHLDRVPKEFRAAISGYCYEKHHAYGEDEVLSNVIELIEVLEKPINEFYNSILKNLNGE